METISSNARSTAAFTSNVAFRGAGGPIQASGPVSQASLGAELKDSFVPTSTGLGNLNDAIAQNRRLRELAQSKSGSTGGELRYGDAQVHFVDGTVTSSRSAKAFARNIEKAGPNTIKAIVIRGHGSDRGTTLSGSDGPYGADSLVVTQRPAGPGLGPVMELTLSGSEPGTKPFRSDFTKLLEGKIDPSAGGGIYINSCSVAKPLAGDKNLVEVVSEKLPGITVRGVDGTLNESRSRVTGNYSDKPAWGSKFVYSKDGVQIESPWSHPYTVFSDES